MTELSTYCTRLSGEFNCERLRKDLTMIKRDLAKNAVLDEFQLRVSLLSFIVRVFRTARRFVTADRSARSADADMRINLPGLIQVQSWKHVFRIRMYYDWIINLL